jgi:hypothetical protein
LFGYALCLSQDAWVAQQRAHLLDNLFRLLEVRLGHRPLRLLVGPAVRNANALLLTLMQLRACQSGNEQDRLDLTVHLS